MEAFFQLGVFISLLLLGYFFGRLAEKRHYSSIFKREKELRNILVTTERFPPTEHLRDNCRLVCGNVVISIDYFKLVAASLKALLGGRLTAYESLLDRARREAILRMQEEADSLNAHTIINMKFETSRISGDASKGIGSMEVLAYGTALFTR